MCKACPIVLISLNYRRSPASFVNSHAIWCQHIPAGTCGKSPLFFTDVLHTQNPGQRKVSWEHQSASVVHVYSKSTSFIAYERVGMVSHVQMAACLAQRAVPQMIRESVRWSEWEELPFVPPPHPHHPKSNKVVQSFCSAKNFHLLLSSPPSLPPWRCFTSFLTSSQVDSWSSVMLLIPPSSAHLAGSLQLFRSQRLHLQMCPRCLRGSGMMAWWAHWFLTCCSLNKERNESVKEIVKSWMRPVGRTFPLSRKLHLTTYRREHWGARLGATPEWMALCQLPCHQAHSLLVSLICPSPFSLSPSLTHPPPLLCSFHKLRTPSPFFSPLELDIN